MIRTALSICIFSIPISQILADDELKPAPTAEGEVAPIKKNIPSPQAEINPTRPDGKTIPKMERIDADSIKIGNVTVNHKKRIVSFPCKVNMNEGLIEYAIVMPFGKTHEALLISDADPFHVTLGMKLLKMKEFKGFFPKMLPDKSLDRNFVEPPRKAYEKSIIQVHARWKSTEGREIYVPFSDLIFDSATNRAMADGDWLYTDSIVDNGIYQASLIGDLIAIYNDHASLINYCGPKHDNDEIWQPMPKRVPALGHDITIEISLPKEANENKPPEAITPEQPNTPKTDAPPADRPAGPWG